MKEEVDEANGEDKEKTDTSAENKDTAASKGAPLITSLELLLLHLCFII